MSALPYFNLYPGDFLADTGHLNAEETGAYLLLLMASWTRGPLPDDDKLLARLARVSVRKWRAIKATVLEFFDLCDGKFASKRLEEERSKATKKSAVRSAAGKLGGQAKSKPTKAEREANALRLLKQKPSIPEPEPTSEEEDCRPPTAPERLHKGRVFDGDLFPTMPGEKPPPRADDVQQAVDAYREAAKRVPMWADIRKLTSARRSAVASRLKDAGGLEGWKAAILRAEQSHFLCGETKEQFRLSLDFLCQESSFIKLIEGKYDNKPPRTFNEVSSNGRHQAQGHNGWSGEGFQRFAEDRGAEQAEGYAASQFRRYCERHGLEVDPSGAEAGSETIDCPVVNRSASSVGSGD